MATLETKINSKWWVKILIFFIALASLGVWGLVDATIVYPARGVNAAKWAEWQYLEAAGQSGELVLATIDDPVAEMKRLSAEETALQKEVAMNAIGVVQAKTKLQRLLWLRSLSLVGRLSPDYTRIEDPVARLAQLQADPDIQTAPKPLDTYDIPLQWVFVAGGFGGALWLGALFLIVHRRVFRFNRETFELTLPCGATVAAKDVTEFDKRKWDKFIVVLRTAEGTSHRLDLLRHTPLEEWVLAMERHVKGEEPADAEAPADAQPSEPNLQ